MNTTAKIFTGLAITGGVVGLAYLAYKKFGPQPSGTDPAVTLAPAGTSSTGIQMYVDQAGKLVDNAGKLINTITNAIPKSDYEGSVIRVAKGKVYLVKDGLQRYIPNDEVLNQYGGWAAVKEVSKDVAPIGTPLAGIGLGCACYF